MQQISQVIRNMIDISNEELESFLAQATVKTVEKKALISRKNYVPNEIYFINQGMIRVRITDREGTDHTVHFGMENQFIADYSSFMMNEPGVYDLQALEKTEVVLLPRSAIEWGYQNLKQGDRMGRLIAEFYFLYHDNRIKNQYDRTPGERYQLMEKIFPGIHNRVPQHMIASYLGITPVHLSRLKKMERVKI